MSRRVVQAEFGAHAESYAQSPVHARGASLERLVDRTGPQATWQVLDIATGAGHTAFTFAPHTESVLATDITTEMLGLTVTGAVERGIKNISVVSAGAEQLPFTDNRFDLVTCRIAAHHFSDIEAFLKESYRVLRSGGMLALVDNVVPPGVTGAIINALEKLRDRSHGRCLSMDAWESACRTAGFQVKFAERLRKQMVFSFWAKRHDTVVQSYLRAWIIGSSGEAKRFLQPEERDGELTFYLTEGLLIAQKPGGD